MRVTLIVIGVIVGILLLTAGGWAWRYFTAPVRGIVGAEEQIESAPSRITNYEHFYDLCASVQGHEHAIDAQREQLAAANDPDEINRIQANLAGLAGQRARAIAQYNADARKQYTRARFRASDLPYQLPSEAYTGEKTRCAM